MNLSHKHKLGFYCHWSRNLIYYFHVRDLVMVLYTGDIFLKYLAFKQKDVILFICEWTFTPGNICISMFI